MNKKSKKLVVTLGYTMDKLLFEMLSFSNRGYFYMDADEVKQLSHEVLDELYSEMDKVSRDDPSDEDWYPARCYYPTIAYSMEMTDKRERWCDLLPEGRMSLMDEASAWYASKIDEVREPNDYEIEALDKSGKSYCEVIANEAEK